jgi:hypothetical protein
MLLSDPQQMHGYTYANNNPLTWSDPTGLARACLEICGGEADKKLVQHERKRSKPTGSRPSRNLCQSHHPCANPGAPGQATPGRPPSSGGSPSGGGPERLTDKQAQEILDASIVLEGNLVLAPSSRALNEALDASEREMCKGKLFCSRDSWLTDSGYWEAVAWTYICNHHRDWCGLADDSVFVSAGAHQESGVGSAVKALLPKALTTGYNSGKGVTVYIGTRNGKDVYVGINVSVESQKVFTKTVLLDLPNFPERIQGAAHRLLQTLVGPSTLQFVEGRLHVSGDQPLVESPKDQTARLLRERDSPAGLLGLVLRMPLSDTAYEGIYSDAIQALDDLLATVRGDRGYEWRLRQRTATSLDRLIRWLVKPELEPRKGVAR